MKITEWSSSKFLQSVQLECWDDVSNQTVETTLKWLEDEQLMHRLQQSLRYATPLHGEILDLGAGSLWLTAYLSKLDSIKRVCAVELAKNRIEQIGIPLFNHLKGNADKTEVFVGDAHQLKFADKTFDFILCDGFLHHLDNLKFGLKEIHRVLRKGGYLIAIREPATAYYRNPEKVIPQKHIDVEYQRYTKQYMYEIAERGFHLRKILRFPRSEYRNIKVNKQLLACFPLNLALGTILHCDISIIAQKPA